MRINAPPDPPVSSAAAVAGAPAAGAPRFKRPISTLIDVKFQFQPFEATSEDIFNKVIFSKPTEMGSIELQMTILKMEAPEALTADIVNHPQSFLNYE